MIKKLEELVKDACRTELAQVGVNLDAWIGNFVISSDFSGWLGLNIGRHGTYLRVNVNVGVHCRPIMELMARVDSKRYRPLQIATYSIPLISLDPALEEFVFPIEVDVAETAKRLGMAVAEMGMPYAKAIANYDELLPLLEKRVRTLGGYPERYAACLFLSGAEQQSMDFIEHQSKLFHSNDNSDVAASLAKLGVLLRDSKNGLNGVANSTRSRKSMGSKSTGA